MGVRQVFPGWAITVPLAFDEVFLAKDGYWHAWDEHRSVSLTSVAFLDEKGRRPSARRILKKIAKVMPRDAGEGVAAPANLAGWAAVISPAQPARATRAISGIVAVEGRALLATITADDLIWATVVWLSIRRQIPRRPAGDA